MGGGDAVHGRPSRGSERRSGRSMRSTSKSRSRSMSSYSDRSRSRSRSRERSSRRRRSHRRHRSRSRSANRDRGRHHSSRRSSHHRRGRSRSREPRSSRKRSRRSRSRSTDRPRRHSSGDGDDLSRGRSRRDSGPRDEKRARHGALNEPANGVHASTTATASESVSVDVAAAQPAVPQSEDTSALESSTPLKDGDQPGSQDSAVTSAAASQSDIEAVASVAPEDSAESPTRAAVEPPSEEKPKVDVKSIKMDILKALADARSAIAGIKAVAPSAEKSTVPEAVVHRATQSKGTITHDVAQSEGDDEGKADASLSENQNNDGDAVEPSLQATPSAASSSAPPQSRAELSAVDVDEFDMFSAAEVHDAGLTASPVLAPATVVTTSAIQSNFDDAEGYYRPNVGEVLNGKYRVLGTVGKGVFSTVLRCQNISAMSEDQQFVAIKLIRSNEVMREASQTEIRILSELAERDPRDKKHCVRLLERFEHHNHVALVFESMQMNVREAMKKFGGKGGISIHAVRIFAKHMLIALSHLEACDVVHADIKPDNVLLDDKQTMIKLCDFGSAFKMNEGKNDPTPYLVSRFYRAPEIVLGLPYDKAVDMWSVGCCLYEMFTGKVMFPGATNNEMLKLFMELKGKVPNKIIKKHRQAYIEHFQMEPHFTEDNKFCSHELDRVTGKPVRRLMDAIKTRFDLGGALLSAKSSTEDRKLVLELRNLLERMFSLDPAKRITPKEALAHPFVKTDGKPAQ